MALDWNELERLSEDLGRRAEKAYTEVSQALWQQTQGMTAQETAIFMNSINLEELMAAKLANVFVEFEQGILKILDDTFLQGTISGEFLQSQLNNATRYLSNELIMGTSQAMRDEIMKGIANGLDISDIVSAMKKLGFDSRHLETVVRTGFTQFDNAITNAMINDMEGDPMLVYIGAYDGKTRPECEKKILSSPAKRSQVIATFGNLDNEIWNCRHKWEPVTNNISDQGYEGKKSGK